MAENNGSTSIVAIIGVVVIIILLALYFYSDLSKKAEENAAPVAPKTEAVPGNPPVQTKVPR
jgi:hypothetical protein